MVQVLRLCVVCTALLTIGWARPASADDASVVSVASTTSGSRRDVAYVQDGTLWVQRLRADGSPRGGRLRVVDGQSESRDVVIASGPGASVVGVHDHNFFAWYFVKLDGGWSVQGFPCIDSSPVPVGSGSVAWNGAVYMIAASCWSDDVAGTVVTTFVFDPSTITFTERFDIPAPDAGAVNVAASGSSFLVSWQQVGRTDDLNVVAQRFSTTGDPVDNLLFVAAGEGDQMQPAAAGHGDGSFLVTWVDGMRGQRDIRGRLVRSNGSLGPGATLVSAAGDQNHPSPAPAAGGGWHLAWADLRSGNNDVYSTHLSSSLTSAPAAGHMVAGGPGPQQSPTASPLAGGRGYATYLDGGVAKVRDLDAASAPTGDPRTVSASPK